MPKKLRFFTAYLIHYFKKYSLAIILGIVFGSLIYSQRNFLIQFGKTVFSSRTDIGMEGIYTMSNLPLPILSQISYGLTSATENDKAILSPLVDKLEIQNNNLSYVFTLKDNVYWHNGKKLISEDVDINIPKIKVIATTDNVITVTTPESFAPLLSFLSQPLFFKKTIFGLGEMKVDNISYQDGHIKLLKLSSVDDKSRQHINYHFYQNNSDLYNAFKLGEVDTISTTTLDNQLDSWPKIKISPSISTSQYIAIFFNTDKINSKQDRQALAYATPKSSEKNHRCLGPISPNSWAYNPEIKQYNFNITRAKELYEKNITQINLTVADRKLLTLSESIKKSWEENLGIKVNLKILNGPLDTSNYEALLTYSEIPSDPDQYSLWHSTQTNTNITHFNNSRIDKLLEEGRSILDQQERKKVYTDFQKFLLEESPAIFLEFPTTYNISRVK